MRAIRNFLHDINDIVLALIIVAVAAGIIYWRMALILDYPKQIAAENASYMQEDSEEADSEDADEEADAGESAEESSEGTGDGDN